MSGLDPEALAKLRVDLHNRIKQHVDATQHEMQRALEVFKGVPLDKLQEGAAALQRQLKMDDFLETVQREFLEMSKGVLRDRLQEVEAALQRQLKMRDFLETVQRELPRALEAAKRDVVRDAARIGNKRYDAEWAKIKPVLDTLDQGLSRHSQAFAVVKLLILRLRTRRLRQ